MREADVNLNPFPPLRSDESVEIGGAEIESLNRYAWRLWPEGPPLPFPLRPRTDNTLRLTASQTKHINRTIRRRVSELQA